MGRSRCLVSAAVLLPLVVLVLLGGSAIDASIASGGTRTATPSPTPYPQSTIRIRFISDGQPVLVWLSEPLGGIHADGVLCDIPITAEVVLVDGFTGVWPLGGGLPTECTKGPPTTLRYEFHASTALVAEFVWTGQSVTLDLEVPEDVAVTPTPAPFNATNTPAELPPGGGRPDSQSDGAFLTVAILGSMIATLGLGAGWLNRSGRRGRE